MTFGLVLATPKHLVQACDRRLTDATGKIVDDSSQKSGHILCDDASLIYCFTGLARWRSHTTSKWLLESLQGIAAHNYWDIVEGITAAATKNFAENRNLLQVPPASRRLTIMISGYRTDGSIVNALISNFEDFTNFVDHPVAQDKFTLHAECSRSDLEWPTMIQAIGQFHAITRSDEADLRKLLVNDIPGEALKEKAISYIQELSDRPSTNGTVGKKINTARLAAPNVTAPIAGYASDEAENKIHLLDQVDLRTGASGILIRNLQLSVSNELAVIPKVHRNALCPCGSGIKYKHCHR